MAKCMSNGGSAKKGAVELKDKGSKGYAAGGAAKARRGGFPGIKKAALPAAKKK